MRVNVTYSVELEDVPQTAAKLIHNAKENSLAPLTKKLDEALILLDKEDEKNAVYCLDEVRQELSKIDLRLADCVNILSGYQNVMLGNIKDFENLDGVEKAIEKAVEETNGTTNEEG
jgi:hypothetical protein